MSGPLSAIFGGIAIAFPSIPARVVYFILASVAFLVATFDVWRREHRRVLELQTVGAKPDPVALEHRAWLGKKLEGLSEELQGYFFEIALGGPVAPQTFFERGFDPLTPLRFAGLLQYNDQTKLWFVTPENVQAAKAIREAQIAARSSAD